MKAGTHQLMLSAVEGKEGVSVEVKPGMKTIVYCTALPGGMKSFAACTDKIK